MTKYKPKIQGTTAEQSKTKRKKDGVFYTPKYITKYIVDNTVGKLCEEKKAELDIQEAEYEKERKGRQKTTLKKLNQKLEDYRKWLLQITICDPACGSGAFLNQALEFLIAEHQYIDELQAKLFGDAMVLSEVENAILENNLFGVDINEESVDIAKLSLWLRTAQKGRKLTSLNNNIKCGNSLIDDPIVAGDKAFNWQNEFSEVFANGGFDVVIGNPPYVRQELFKEIKPYLQEHYKCYNSVADLYTYFIEQGINLMNENGLFSFILPNKFLKATYGKNIRKVIKEETNIELLLDFDDYPVFDDATTYPIIYVLNKKQDYKTKTFAYSEINKRDKTNDPINTLELKKYRVEFNTLRDENWIFINKDINKVIIKLNKESDRLKEVVHNKIFRGVSTGCNEVFIINQETKDKLGNSENIKKILMGKEVKRNLVQFQGTYLLFIPWDYDLNSNLRIKDYLISNREKLERRPEVKAGRFNWWCLSRYGSKNSHLLNESKIIYPRINNKCNFFIDHSGEYSLSDNNFFISTKEKEILPILNSNLVFFFLKNISSTLQGGYYDFRRPYVEKIPIKIPKGEDKKLLITKSEQVILLNKKFEEHLCSIQEFIFVKYGFDKLSRKLENWHELEFASFLKELKKLKIALTLSEEAQWMDYFNLKKKEAQELKTQIDKTDKDIDQMVYELYGLTEEEIKIVEEATV